MKHFPLYNIKFVIAFLTTFLGMQLVNAQSADRPRSDASRICANSASPIFSIESAYDASAFSAGNIFSLLLSDEDGLFNNSRVIGELPTDNSGVLEFEIDFSDVLDSFEGSDNYKLKIESSDFPDSDSQALTIPIYYVDGTIPLDTELSNLCDPPVFIFAVQDDFGEGEYAWYRAELGVNPVNFGNSTLIPGETSNQIMATEVGQYFFAIDIGECSSSSATGGLARSNLATVELTQGIDDLSIIGASFREECSDVSIELVGSTDDPALSYKWFKGTEELEDINTASFTVSGSETPFLTVSGIDAEGDYRLAAATGEIGECTSQSDPVAVILKNPKITIITPSPVLLLPPGEPQTLTAEIRGDNPEITWFRTPPNSTTLEVVNNSNSVSIEVTEPGTYTASLTAESECIQDNTVMAREEVLVIGAENLNITIAYNDPDYDDCELNETILEVTEVTATVDGSLVVLDESALQSLQVDWQRDGVSTGETERTILINSASDNGLYTAVINNETSNPLPVILSLDSFQITKTPEDLAVGGTIELSLGLVDTTDFTFQWFRNTTEEIPGSNSESITVSEPGRYTVQVFFDTCGAVTVGPVVVTSGSLVIPNVITPNDDGINDDWVLPSNFSQQENVEINVYASNGELDYSTVNYNGEWPEESKSKAVGTVYYYVINVDNSPVEQGSITIIR